MVVCKRLLFVGTGGAAWLTVLVLGCLVGACASGGGRAVDLGADDAGINEQSNSRFDLLILGASIVDGSGDAAYHADVGIREGRIAEIGDLTAETSDRRVDARGLTLTPGFIDVHSHAAGGLESEVLSAAEPLLAQGVTTVVVNPDGGGPVDLTKQRQRLVKHGLGVNVAQLIPHGSVRRQVLGEDDVKPDSGQLATMVDLVGAAMDSGAWGLSSGTFYAPGSYAEPAEVIALAEPVAASGGIYTSHIRDESDYTVGLLAAVKEVIDVARATGVTAVVTHIKALGPGVWGSSAAVVQAVENARADGLAVFADQYPYEASATQLGAALLPRWAQAGGREKMLERLGDSEVRGQVLEAMSANLVRRGGPARIQFRRVPEDPAVEGRLLSAVAAERGVDELELALRMIEVGSVGIVSFNMEEADIRRFMQQDWTMTSSDGGLVPFGQGVPHPRNYGAFARKIERYVVEERVVSLAAAVRSMSGLPAEVIGLRDRGLIRVGRVADLALFDPVQLHSPASFTDPHHLAVGVRLVLVNGNVAFEDGNASDNLSGTVLIKNGK